MPRIPQSIRNPAQIFGAKPGTLRNIVSHAEALTHLQSRLRAHFAGDFYVAGVNEGTLHLITPSGALATRLRYNQRAIIGLLHEQHISRVKVSVRPDPIQSPKTEQPARLLSPESAGHLASTAKYIEDSALRKALIRLSTRTTPKPD